MDNIIDKEEERNELLLYLNNNINNDEEKKFINDFYFIFFKNSHYVVDSKIIQKWLIYSEKSSFKRFFEKILKEDEDYCIYKKNKKEEFIFTIDAYKNMLIKYDEELKLFKYFSRLEKNINNYIIIYKDKLHNIEKNKLLENMEKFEDIKKPVIYIYNIDIRSKNIKPILKIGLTENIQERVKTYTTSHPNGLLVYKEEINKNSLKITEKFLHHLLTEAGYLVKSECFELSIEEAKLWINHVNNNIKLTNINDRYNKLYNIVSNEKYEIDNIKPEKKILHFDISTQTDGIVEEIKDDEADIKPMIIIKDPPKNIFNFNKFIEECCIIDRELEVSSVDIIGKYRIWMQSADKNTYLELLDYLKDVFKPVRMQKQDKNTVINGFKGISLKEIDNKFELPLIPSNYDLFIYNFCDIAPANKVLFFDIKNTYIEWQKRINNIDILDKEIEELKKYFNNNKNILKSNVWTHNGNGSGYYGICLKKDSTYHKTVSTTSKIVQKIDIITNNIIEQWTTIKKASIDEKIPTARMSRLCKSKEIIEDRYFYKVC